MLILREFDETCRVLSLRETDGISTISPLREIPGCITPLREIDGISTLSTLRDTDRRCSVSLLKET